MEKGKGISASILKIIAMITMLIDHSAAAGLLDFVNMNNPSINTWQLYTLMRSIGRIAFPIYLFLLIEGYHKTKDVKKYILRLFIFALISEIPFDLGLYSSNFYLGHQNVFFELTLLMIMFHLLTVFDKNVFIKIVVVLAVVAISMFIEADYSIFGIIAGLVMYYGYETREKRAITTALGFWFELSTPMVLISPILIYFYNGVKGKGLNKYFYYAFYPGHLVVIALLKYLIYNDVALINL